MSMYKTDVFVPLPETDVFAPRVSSILPGGTPTHTRGRCRNTSSKVSWTVFLAQDGFHDVIARVNVSSIRTLKLIGSRARASQSSRRGSTSSIVFVLSPNTWVNDSLPDSDSTSEEFRNTKAHTLGGNSAEIRRNMVHVHKDVSQAIKASIELNAYIMGVISTRGRCFTC